MFIEKLLIIYYLNITKVLHYEVFIKQINWKQRFFVRESSFFRFLFFNGAVLFI